jgi:hypothetical protein
VFPPTVLELPAWGSLPPTSALLRRAQGPSSRKREDSRSLRSLGPQGPSSRKREDSQQREYLDTRTLPPLAEGAPATKEPGGWGVLTNGT